MSEKPYSIIQTLKIDMFSIVYLALFQGRKVIIRNLNIRNNVYKLIGKCLNRNEITILKKIHSLRSPNFPKLIHAAPRYTIRSYLSGTPINQFPRKLNEDFFSKALALIQMMHRQGIVHNDLEKPENWIVMDNGEPGIIDFQLAKHFPKKTFLFRQLQRIDIRHIIKLKKRFCMSPLSPSETKLLNNRSTIHNFIHQYIKPIYNFLTRKLFNYSDRKFDQYYN